MKVSLGHLAKVCICTISFAPLAALAQCTEAGCRPPGTPISITPTATPTPNPSVNLNNLRVACSYDYISTADDGRFIHSYNRACNVELKFSKAGSPAIFQAVSCVVPGGSSSCVTSNSGARYKVQPGYVFDSARAWFFPNISAKEAAAGCVPATLGEANGQAIISPSAVRVVDVAGTTIGVQVTYRDICTRRIQ